MPHAAPRPLLPPPPCLPQIHEKVDPDTIAKMRATVAGIKEEDFKYDKEYIEETMGWAAPAPPAVQHVR